MQGGSVIKPLVGPLQMGPSDAAVVRPKLSSRRGVVLGCGMRLRCGIRTRWRCGRSMRRFETSLRSALILNVCAILDNFCWPSVDDELTMGTLVRACEACRDAAIAYGIPFISGKDSLHNQFTNQETGEVLRIPNTLLISAIGVIDDVAHCLTMDLKSERNVLLLVEPAAGAGALPAAAGRDASRVARAIKAGQVSSCHDVSDGGVLVCLAEMCIGSGKGATLIADLDDAALLAEIPGRYVIEVPDNPQKRKKLEPFLPGTMKLTHLGDVSDRPELVLAKRRAIISVAEMSEAWRGTLNW